MCAIYRSKESRIGGSLFLDPRRALGISCQFLALSAVPQPRLFELVWDIGRLGHHKHVEEWPF